MISFFYDAADVCGSTTLLAGPSKLSNFERGVSCPS